MPVRRVSDDAEVEPGERRRRLGPGLVLAGYLAGALVLALLPARIALALYQAEYSGNAWQLIVVGLAVDTPFVIATYTLVNAVGLGVVSAIRRGRPSLRATRVIVVAATSAGFLFVLWGCISATEFKVERGLYPTSFDLSVALADFGYVRSALGTFFLARFFWGWLIAVLGFVGLSVWFLKATASIGNLRMLRELGTTAVVLGAMAAAGFGLHRASPHLFRSIANWRVVESPFPTFFASLGSSNENIRFGFMALIEQTSSPESEREKGAAMLGLAPAGGARVTAAATGGGCAPHPLAEPLPPVGDPGPGVNNVFAIRAGNIVDDLSRELFEKRARVRVWQISLESLRADDLSALNERAPAGLAPTLDGLYASAALPIPRVIASKRMFQAGVRTSQALSATLCGNGTMPWGLSFARDIGLVPFRCAPDVLKDAGFSLHFYYGSNPAFDNMLSFLQYHGFDHMLTERGYVEETPHSGWAVPDRIVFSQALAASNARPRDESQYNLLMTLSHHHPFPRPEDFPPEVGERVATTILASKRNIGADDRKRLDTLSYSDFALGEMLARIDASEAARDSLVVISGDHATAEYFLWRDEAGSHPEVERRVALSRVPFLIVLPEALVKSLANPSKVGQLISELNSLLAENPISQNDMPRLLLGLLSRSFRITTLPAAWRWHTLGGQALSRHFRVPTVPEARVIGIDASSRLFWMNEAGALVDPNEPATPIFDVDAARNVTPTLGPEVALLTSFMRGYARRCWEWRHIRKVR